MNKFALTFRLQRLMVRLANANGAKYLLGLNLKKLNEGKRPSDADPKTYYQELQEKAKTGPIFDARTLAFIESLDLELDKQELQWLATNVQTTGRPSSAVELPQLFDYLRAEKPELRGLTYNDAVNAADEWHEQFTEKAETAGPYKTKHVVLDLKSQGCWVNVPEVDCKTEGELMGHCVGSYAKKVASGGTKILSLRDTKGLPHVTVEVTGGKVIQIQGKENKRPVEKYHKSIELLLKDLALPITAATVPYISDPATIEGLADSEDTQVRAMIAGSAKLRDETYLRLARDVSTHVRSSLAANPKITKEVSAILVADSDNGVRFSLSRNQGIDEDTVSALAKDTDAYVLQQIVDHAKLGPEDLKRLSEVDSDYIRRRVAKNKVTPLPIIAHMATHDDSPEVLAEIACRFDLTPEIVKVLVTKALTEKVNPHDQSLAYRTARSLIAHQTLSESDVMSFAKLGNSDLLEIIIQKGKATPKLCAQLSKSHYKRVRDTLASSTHTPKDVLDGMVTDDSKSIRDTLAANANLSARALAILATDKSNQVRLTVVQNPSTSTETLRILAKDKIASIRQHAKDRLVKK